MTAYFYVTLVLLAIILIFTLFKRNSTLKKIALDLQLGGIIYGGLVAVYSLLLAFVVVIVWQQYQVTGDRIESEASKLLNIYRSSYAFKDTSSARIRRAVVNYVESVKNDEWYALEHDSLSTKTQKVYDQLWHVVYEIKPFTEEEKIWYASIVQNINQFGEARHLRLSDRDASIPPIMWYMLVAGATLIILFSILLFSDNNFNHLLKVLMISTMIIFSLLLVYLLDHPFQGTLKIEPTAFEKINILDKMDLK